MKRALLAALAAVVLLATGCQALNDPCRPGLLNRGGCDNEAAYHVGHPGLCHHDRAVAPPGPPTPTYGYPYYTLRGPRDFLVDNPPSIGP